MSISTSIEPLSFWTVDSFTDEAFKGNPAAVVVYPSDDSRFSHDDSTTFINIAAEFNLSETAFVTGLDKETASERPRFGLRWFTPTEEVPLCGHATLATAHILFTHLYPTATSLEFVTRHRGTLVANRSSESTTISLDFPAANGIVLLEQGHRRREKIVNCIMKVLSLQKGGRRVPEEDEIERIAWADQIPAVIVQLSTKVDLEGLEVDPSLLSGLGDMVILTQPAPVDSPNDIHSRVFAPDIGVPEDPVTGAAHTALAPFYLDNSQPLSTLHRSESIQQSRTIKAKQVSKRGGELTVVLSRDGKRVELRGQAREVMRGQLEF